MSFISASIRLFPGAPERKLCEIEHDSLEQLRDSIGRMRRPRTGFAKLLKRHIRENLGNADWDYQFQFGDYPELGRRQSPVTIDVMKDVRNSGCGHYHRVLVEICTDNRQAIPLNLLKLEFASRRFEESSVLNFALPVLVVLNDENLSLVAEGAVDNAVGTFNDYVMNANGPWQGLVQSNLHAVLVS
jgi:hypothetical protein